MVFSILSFEKKPLYTHLKMSKLDGIKQKISELKSGLAGKVEKIPFLKRFLGPLLGTASSAPSASGSPAESSNASANGGLASKKFKKNEPGLTTIYREGSTLTRLQVILVYVLFIGALVATAVAGKKFFQRLKQSDAHEQLKSDVSHGLEEMKEKVIEKANLVSVGKFTVNVFAGGRPGRMMAVDIWLRMSDPEAAGYAQKNESVVYDRITDAFQEIYLQQIDLLEESGKEEAKEKILESINKALPKGKAEEIFFENFIVQ